MIKKDELNDPGSCLNNAKNDEMVFVLRAHDIVASSVIRFWVSERIRIGKNRPDDVQIRNALDCALDMERQRNKEMDTQRNKQHDWTLYMNGTFCRKCGLAIGTNGTCY